MSTGPMTHFRGDAVTYTGKSEHLYGALCYETVLVEGHRKGQTVWTHSAPSGKADAVVDGLARDIGVTLTD